MSDRPIRTAKRNYIDPEIWGPYFRKQGIDLSSRALADASGVSFTTIAAYFRGDRIPADDKAKKIADALSMPVSQFLDLLISGQARTGRKPFVENLPAEVDYLEPQERAAVLDVIRVILEAKGYPLRGVGWNARSSVESTDEAQPGSAAAAAVRTGGKRRRRHTS